MSRENKKQIIFIKNNKPHFELKKSHKRQKNSMSWIYPSLRTFFKVTPEESFQMDEEKKQQKKIQKIYNRFLFGSNSLFPDVSLKLREIFNFFIIFLHHQINLNSLLEIGGIFE